MLNKNIELVSVVIPTYNSSKTIVCAINSVLKQTYQNFEIIVCDDGSTDSTKDLILAINDKRITWLPGEHSGLPAVPRNRGIDQANGEWIAFLDSDDEWLPYKLNVQVNSLKESGRFFSYHDMEVQYWDKYRCYKIEQWSQMSTPHYGMVHNKLLKKNFIVTSSVMVEKRLFWIYGYMSNRYKVSHDWDLWLRMAYANEIDYIGMPMGLLRIHKSDKSVISDTHIRRSESRQVVRKWKDYYRGSEKNYYYKILLYYYIMEIFDALPAVLRNRIRSKWYEQEKYK